MVITTSNNFFQHFSQVEGLLYILTGTNYDGFFAIKGVDNQGFEQLIVLDNSIIVLTEDDVPETARFLQLPSQIGVILNNDS